MVPICAYKKKTKKGKRGKIQASFQLKLGHGALEATKRGGGGGEQTISLPNLSDGILNTHTHTHTHKEKRRRGSKLFFC
jgi:hypothetical protein